MFSPPLRAQGRCRAGAGCTVEMIALWCWIDARKISLGFYTHLACFIQILVYLFHLREIVQAERSFAKDVRNAVGQTSSSRTKRWVK